MFFICQYTQWIRTIHTNLPQQGAYSRLSVPISETYTVVGYYGLKPFLSCSIRDIRFPHADSWHLSAFALMTDSDTATFRSTGGRSSFELHKQG